MSVRLGLEVVVLLMELYAKDNNREIHTDNIFELYCTIKNNSSFNSSTHNGRIFLYTTYFFDDFYKQLTYRDSLGRVAIAPL